MSLYELQRDGDVDELLAVLQRSDSVAVRRRAAEALGELDVDGEEAVEVLIDVAATDDGEEVRAAAVDALDRIGRWALERFVADLAGVEIDDDRADRAVAETFTDLLDSDRPEVRMAAATALGDLGDSGATTALLDRLDDPDALVRVRVVRALGEIGDRRAVDPLTAMVSESPVPVRRAAADALGALEDERALDALAAALDDNSEGVRRTAAAALGEFSRAEPIAALVSALTDESELVRRAAVYSVVQLLSDAPSERSHEVRESVVEELAAVDDRSVTAPLVELIEESTQPVQRRNATWLLGRVSDGRDEDVVNALVVALDDDDPMTPQFAATSLAEIGGDLVRERLLESVDNFNASVDARAMAVFALGKVGGRGVRERLESLAEETDHESVRKRAFGALSKLGGAQ